jgi:hypothetical protein
VDFIEIYRAQRAQIQTRVAEKEEECQQLRKIRVELEVGILILKKLDLKDYFYNTFIL